MPRTTGGPRTAARAAAAASALFWMVIFFGLIDLAVPVEETPGFYASYLLDTGWGVLYTFLVGAAFTVLIVRPAAMMPVTQVVIVALCLTVTAVVAGAWGQLVPAMLLVIDVGVVAALAQDPRWLPADWSRPRLDPWVGLVAVSAGPPAVWFAIDMVRAFRTGRPPLDADTWGIDHWPTQAALALAVVGVGVAVAAGVRGRWPGTLASSVCVVVAAGWFGYWSATFPGHAGSAGRAWGVALLVWAVVLLGVVAWRLRAESGRLDHDVRR